MSHDSNFGGIKAPENSPKSVVQHERTQQKLCSWVEFRRDVNGEQNVDDILVFAREVWRFSCSSNVWPRSS